MQDLFGRNVGDNRIYVIWVEVLLLTLLIGEFLGNTFLEGLQRQKDGLEKRVIKLQCVGQEYGGVNLKVRMMVFQL